MSTKVLVHLWTTFLVHQQWTVGQKAGSHINYVFVSEKIELGLKVQETKPAVLFNYLSLCVQCVFGTFRLFHRWTKIKLSSLLISTSRTLICSRGPSRPWQIYFNFISINSNYSGSGALWAVLLRDIGQLAVRFH